jgi:hypothetical protein
MSNVIRLPRPRSQRPAPEGLGFVVRLGRNDHNELQHLIRTGEDGIFRSTVARGRVDEPCNAWRRSCASGGYGHDKRRRQKA